MTAGAKKVFSFCLADGGSCQVYFCNELQINCTAKRYCEMDLMLP